MILRVMIPRVMSAAAIAAALTACSSLPPVTASYYLPAAETDFSVTQTLGCTPDNARLIIATSVAAPTLYHADLTRPQTLDFAQLGGFLADADTTLNFTSDGRLSGINSATAGEAASAIKAGVSLATAVSAMAVLSAAPSPSGQTPPRADLTAACKTIAALPGNGAAAPGKSTAAKAAAPAAPSTAKVVTLFYSLAYRYDMRGCGTGGGDCAAPAGDGLVFAPDSDSRSAFGALAEIGTLAQALRPAIELGPVLPITPGAVARGGVGQPSLTLAPVGLVGLTVSGLSDEWNDEHTALARQPLWRGNARVPLQATYQLPLPAPAMFGKTQFELALGDDGSITKLRYGKTGGTADALGAAAFIAQSQQAQTAGQSAAALQGQADLIYQQQRLVACQASPKSCPSK